MNANIDRVMSIVKYQCLACGRYWILLCHFRYGSLDDRIFNNHNTFHLIGQSTLFQDMHDGSTDSCLEGELILPVSLDGPVSVEFSTVG